MTRELHQRRRFLGQAGAAALGLSPLGQLLATAAVGAGESRAVPGYGPLREVRDGTTGLPLLRLPAGFSYLSLGWAGEPLADGTPCPGAHDGMGVVSAVGDQVTLIRNHELTRFDGAFGTATPVYDRPCSGGTVTLEFDTRKGELRSARPSLSGTLTNCSGGVTPWGSWLSCEEVVVRAGTRARVSGVEVEIERDHGYVFEVPPDGSASAEPLVAMGQFRHEAVVVHAPSGVLYLTEDRDPGAGFYRFLPKQPGRLAAGGRLQMLAVEGRSDLRTGLRAGQRFQVQWVDIEHPQRGFDEVGGIDGVQQQGFALGGARFTRLEGCHASEREVFFTATNGGDARCGQVFALVPATDELRLLFESTEPEVIDYPDNIVLSPRGGLLICQDAKRARQRLFGLTEGGEPFTFAEQNVVLDGARGFSGDFRGAEWAGACFSPDGRWLFANVYSPGVTFAITGPWRDGLI